LFRACRLPISKGCLAQLGFAGFKVSHIMQFVDAVGVLFTLDQLHDTHIPNLKINFHPALCLALAEGGGSRQQFRFHQPALWSNLLLAADQGQG